MLFLHENALNTQAFPSLRQIQADTVGWTAGLLHGDDDVAGFLTSGGTESILCGVLAARERAAHERGITEPEIVLPESAHAAFHKAAHNFGLTVRKAPVRADWTADVEAMGALVGPNTSRAVMPSSDEVAGPRVQTILARRFIVEGLSWDGATGAVLVSGG